MALTLDSQFLRKLERFEIVPQGVYRGGQIGHRPSPSRGTGLEFADHKEYSAGDDVRYLDWNVYARLEEMFVKLFEQAEALGVYILLDCSRSMRLGAPSKAAFGPRVAAALAYVALANQDHVRAGLFAEGLLCSTRTLRGKTRIYEILELLDAPPAGATDLSEALGTFSKDTRLPGVVFVISDFLDPKDASPAGPRKALRMLAARRFGLCALHVLAPEELSPRLAGDVDLEDVETRSRLRVPLRRDTAERFGAFFRAHCDGLRAELRRCGGRYLRLTTGEDLGHVLFSRFPREGVLR